MSLNSLAEKRALSPWQSWEEGARIGRFELDDLTGAAEFFQENGFLVIENALTMDEVEAVRNDATAVCRGDYGIVRGMPEGTAGLTDEEILKQVLCVHFPHKLSPKMRDMLAHPGFVKVLTQIIGPNVKCMQSMLFVKASGKPGQAWHQDEVYIPTRDRSLCGGWIALDDATVENGCLWVIPGSHKRGIMYFQEWHADPRFDCSFEARRFPYSNDDAVPVEVKAGAIVFFNGYLLHRSLPNYAPEGFRRALVNHYMSAESLLPWEHNHASTKPVSTQDSRDIVMVAGEDPYAYMGTTEYHSCHIRPDGKGGCGNNEYNVAPDDHDH